RGSRGGFDPRRRGAGGRSSVTRPRLLRLADALDADLDARDLAANLVVDLRRDLGVLLQELSGVLASLAEADIPVLEPGTGLRQDAGGDPDVEQATLDADALVVHDVVLAHAARRGDLVLHHLAAGSRPDRIGPGLERLDAPDVHPDAGVELQRAAAGRRLGAAEHDADLLAQLVGEDERRLAAVDGAGELAQGL